MADCVMPGCPWISRFCEMGGHLNLINKKSFSSGFFLNLTMSVAQSFCFLKKDYDENT